MKDQTAFRVIGAVTGSVEGIEKHIKKMYIDLNCIPDVYNN